MARPSHLEGRLLAILDDRRNRRALTSTATAVLVAAFIAVVLPVGMMRAAVPGQDAQAAKPLADAAAAREPAKAGIWFPRNSTIRVGNLGFRYAGGDVLSVYDYANRNPAYPDLRMHIKIRFPYQVNRTDGYEVQILNQTVDQVQAAVKKIDSAEKFGYGIYIGIRPGDVIRLEGGSVRVNGISREPDPAAGERTVSFQSTSSKGVETFILAPVTQKDLKYCTLWVRHGFNEGGIVLEVMDSSSPASPYEQTRCEGGQPAAGGQGSKAGPSAAQSAQQQPVPAPLSALPRRTLHFPADRSMGTISVSQPPHDPWSGVELGPARGDVDIPADRVVCLVADENVPNLAALSRLGPDDLWTLILYRMRVHDSDLGYIRNLRGLHHLMLRSPAVTDAGMAHLRDLVNLDELELPSAGITTAGLAHLEGMQHLRTLDLAETQIDDGALRLINQLPSLSFLNIRGTRMTDVGLAALEELQIDSLCCGGDTLTDRGIEHISAKGVRLWGGANITDKALIALAHNPNLRSLTVDKTPITGSGLSAFQGHSSLTQLSFFETPITDGALAYLPGIPGLATLHLPATKVTDAGLVHLKNCKSLRDVNLNRTAITDNGLEHLAEVESLERLQLWETKITDAGIAKLAVLPRLHDIDARWTAVTPEGLARLTHLDTRQGVAVAGARPWGRLLAAGQVAPDFTVNAMDQGMSLRLSDYRGRIVLLHFWENWRSPFGLVAVREVTSFYENWKRDDRFAMLGLNVDMSPDRGRSYVRQQGLEWPHGFVGEPKQSAVVKAYGVNDHLAWFLIAPDGRILQSGEKLDLDRMEIAVRQAIRSCDTANPADSPGKQSAVPEKPAPGRVTASLSKPNDHTGQPAPRLRALAWQGVDKAGEPCLMCDGERIQAWYPSGEPVPDGEDYREISEGLRQRSMRENDPNRGTQDAIALGPTFSPGERCLHLWFSFPAIDEQSEPIIFLWSPTGTYHRSWPGKRCRLDDPPGAPAWRVFSVPFAPEATTANVRLRFGGGSWVTLPQQIEPGLKDPLQIGPWGRVSAVGQDVSGMGRPQSFVTFSGDPDKVAYAQFGFACITKDGSEAEYAGRRRQGREGSADFLFDVSLPEVKVFQPRWRPIRTITFKNVSLELGHRTDVQVEILDAGTATSEGTLLADSPASTRPAGAPNVYVFPTGSEVRVGAMGFVFNGRGVLSVYNHGKPNPPEPNGLEMHIVIQSEDQVNEVDGYEIRILDRTRTHLTAAVRKTQSSGWAGFGRYRGLKSGETIRLEGGSLKIVGIDSAEKPGDGVVSLESTTPRGTERFQLGRGIEKDVGYCSVRAGGVINGAASLEILARSPLRPPEGPATKPAADQPSAASQDARVEAIFQKLRGNWNREGQYARDKWERLTTIEKAQFINQWAAQGTLKGADWKPAEQEAARFVAEQLTDRLATQQPPLERLLDWIRGNLTKEERSPFEAQEKLLIGELAALGSPAIDALLTQVRQPGQGKLFGLQARWAAEALGRMGEAALPAISHELEGCLAANPAPPRLGYEIQLLAEALAANPSPAAVPLLDRILSCPVPVAAGTALAALEKIPGGVSQERLLELYENDPVHRRRAASLLGERGGQRAIEVLQRDVPTAYAQARYEAEEAIWRVKTRLGLEAGRPPQAPKPLGQSKKAIDLAPLWEGWEMSIRSPNKAIRLEAIGYLGTVAEEQAEHLQTLIAITHTDSDHGVRVKATEYLARAFYSQVSGRRNEGKALDALNGAFDALAETATNGDDEFATAVFSTPYSLPYFSARPAYLAMVARILDGLGSPNMACRAACLGAFAALGQADPRVAALGKAPERRGTISAALREGLSSDYGRYKVDAISAAGVLALKEVVPDLVKIISTAEEWNHRLGAAVALGKIGDVQALQALQQMADTDPYVDASGAYRNRRVAEEVIRAIRAREVTSSSESPEEESSALQGNSLR